MNNSFLYHGFGLYDMQYQSTSYKGDAVIVNCQPRTRPDKCPVCGSRHYIKNGSRRRKFIGLPIGLKKTFFNVKLQRYVCRDCGHDRQEEVTFAKGSRSYIKRVVPYVMDLLKIGTIQDVAIKLGVGWDMIKDMHKEHLKARYGCPSLKGVTRIGIDEFAVRKGHVYKTIVVDLDSGRILHVGDGKGADALDGFWKRVRKNKVNVKVITMDMSPAFFLSVSQNAPGAVIVFDHFHVVKLVNDAIDAVRKVAYKKARESGDEAARKAIKGTRWLLMANIESIEDRSKLDHALSLNKDLFDAYYLKEDLRQIWTQYNKSEAEKKLYEWVEMARDSALKPLIKVANTIMSFRSGILSWYDHRVSNGKVEGINNKIKVLKRVAYGYRDEEYFKLRLFALHDARITRNIG